MNIESKLRRVVAAGILLGAALFAGVATAQINLPPASVLARAYAGWGIQGQQANTYTFNGGACNFAPHNDGNTPSFFVFSGSQNGSTVYFPVYINDANPALSEIVTPTSTVNGASVCGFSASTVNAHTSFSLLSGTAGLQEAVATQLQSAPPSSVLLDPYWYTLAFALPGSPTPESLIKSITGNTNVQIIDTTTSPWTYWRWSGSAYAAVSLSGGAAAPTAAAGAALGTSPTGPTFTGDGNTFSVATTAGSATTTGTLFTATWATSGAFVYPPTCRVWSSGTNSFTAFTTAVTYPSSTHALLTVTATSAPTAATAYAFKVVCN